MGEGNKRIVHIVHSCKHELCTSDKRILYSTWRFHRQITVLQVGTWNANL